MTIVRELVTKLGFTFDRTNLDRFERSIVGFKTKVSLAAAGVVAAFKQGFDFVSSIADASIKTKDLADYAGIAADEFVAIRNAAEKLSLPADKFNAQIEKLAIGIREAQFGFGDFFDTVKRTGGLIDFRSLNGQLNSVKDVLFQIFDYVNALPDQQSKLFALSQIFDTESAGAWLRVISQGRVEFTKLVDKEKDFGKAFAASLPAMQKFQQEVSSLSKEWDKLTNTIAQVLVPALAQSLRGFNAIIDRGNELGGGIKGLFGASTEAVAVGFDDFLGLFPGWESNSQLKERVGNEEADFWRRVNEQETARVQNQNSSSVVNNNTFEFNVPPGTSEQQANYMSDMVKQSMNSYWDEKTREVISNNPTVE